MEAFPVLQVKRVKSFKKRDVLESEIPIHKSIVE